MGRPLPPCLLSGHEFELTNVGVERIFLVGWLNEEILFCKKCGEVRVLVDEIKKRRL